MSLLRVPAPSPAVPGRPGDTGVSPGDTVAGYRLVRLVGAGARAEIYLGFAQSTVDAAAPHTAAVKVFRAEVTDGDVANELEALSRADHPHVVAVRDLAGTPRGQQCLVLERLAGGTLARLLRERSTLTGGEAVTILAPLADALDTLHRSGVAHGGLRIPSVAFRETGAPVLVGLGHAVVFAPGQSRAALAANPDVARDRVAFGELAAAVLSRVPAQRAALLAEQLGPGLGEHPLADAIFELAEPEPVRMPRGAGAHRDAPDRAETDDPGRDDIASRRWEVAPRTPGPAKRRAVRRGRRTPARSRDTPAPVVAVTRAVAAVVGHARQIRGRFWLTAGGVAVSLVVALAIVPPSAEGTRGEAATSTAETPAESPTVAATEAPDPGPALDGTVVDDAALDDAALDDPVVAVAELLGEREQCLLELSLACLEGVLQPGSAAMTSDTALIEAVRAGGERPADASIRFGELVLIERLGDSAIVGLGTGPETTPASTLVMRGEAGWRIRAYLPP